MPQSMLNVLMAPFQIEAISGPVDEWCLGFKINHEFTWVALIGLMGSRLNDIMHFVAPLPRRNVAGQDHTDDAFPQ